MGFDVEFGPDEKPALVQLASAGRVYLFRIHEGPISSTYSIDITYYFTIGTAVLSSISGILADESIVKVGAGVKSKFLSLLLRILTHLFLIYFQMMQ